MSPVTIYTKPSCSFCHRAVALLERKGIAFTEIEAGFDPEKRAEMVRKSGGRVTFPQIFVGDRHIGDSEHLLSLERDGRLEAVLAA